MGHDDAKYPFARIFATASLASSLKPDALPQLRQAFKDSDSAVRYWAALGVLMRGQDAVAAARTDLQKALSDSALAVRVVAAQALGQHGDKADLERALPLLVEHANWAKHDVFTSIAALNALGALGAKAAPALAELKALPDKGPSPDGRYNSYVPRLLTDLIASVDGTAKPAAKKAPAKKAKNKAE